MVTIRKIRKVKNVPKHGALEDFGCISGNFVIARPHLLPFWNPWDIMRALEGCTRLSVTIRKIRKVRNVPKHGVFEYFGCIGGDFVIARPHMIPFWNPWDIGSTLEGCTRLLVTIRKISKVENVQKWRISGVLMGFLSLQPHI